MEDLACIGEGAAVSTSAGPIGGRSDRRLLQRARRGSAEAVEALIDRHWDRAYRVAFGIIGDSHAAEDVTQEAMLAVLGNIGRLDPYRPFAPWLHAVVSNRALDWIRARARRPELPVDPTASHNGLLDTAAAPEDAGVDPELRAALAALPLEQRAVIVLRFVAGYGPKQIGEVLGIPTGTVGSRLRRALDQLRARMEADDG